MNKLFAGPLAVAVAAIAASLTCYAQGNDDSQPTARVWVQYADGRGREVGSALQAVNAKVHYQFHDLRAFAATIPAAAIQGLSANPNVVLVEEDPVRKPFAQQTPWGITDVRADTVWPTKATGGGVLVCVIDSGLYTGHEDHNKPAATHLGSVTGHSKFTTEDWNVDGCGHGTHVAGTIAALSNTLGVIGVSPTEPSSLIPGVSLHIEKVFDSNCGSAYSSDIVNAAQLCRTKGAKVISMSLGSGQSSTTEKSAFDTLYSQGVLSVAAAGNDGNNTFSYPASYDSVISVAAVDNTNTVASFSNQNSQVELAAPGVAVESTVPFQNTLTAADGTTYFGGHIEFSAWASVAGKSMIDGGLCGNTDQNWSGKIVLCQRGTYSFYTKVSNVQNSGGLGAAIYNNVTGGFSGTLGSGNSSAIPAISLSMEDGTALIGKLPSTGTLTSSNQGSGYESWDGTSMATPHVSGVAALIWSANTAKTNADIRQALRNSASDLGALGRDNAYGYGLVQADAALSMLLGSPLPSQPSVGFSLSCANLTCSFTNTSDSGTYNWNFGDGTSSQEAAPSHTYAASGSYPVTLTVTNASGASASTIHQADATASTSDTTPPQINNVKAKALKGSKFQITWDTNEAANSQVTFVNLNNQTYTDTKLVTSHSMSFQGLKNVTYTYVVSSTDAAGNKATSAQYTFKF